MQDLERRSALWQRLSQQGTLDARRATLAEIDFISDNEDNDDDNKDNSTDD